MPAAPDTPGEAGVSSAVNIFRIKNRRGFAAVYKDHLTEGRTALQAFDRMVKAVKRSRHELRGNGPKRHS